MITVRDGKKVAATCPECGCRLEEYWPNYFAHFHGALWKDARGCKCSLIMTFYKVEQDGKVYKFTA